MLNEYAGGFVQELVSAMLKIVIDNTVTKGVVGVVGLITLVFVVLEIFEIFKNWYDDSARGKIIEKTFWLMFWVFLAQLMSGQTRMTDNAGTKMIRSQIYADFGIEDYDSPDKYLLRDLYNITMNVATSFQEKYFDISSIEKKRSMAPVYQEILAIADFLCEKQYASVPISPEAVQAAGGDANKALQIRKNQCIATEAGTFDEASRVKLADMEKRKADYENDIWSKLAANFNKLNPLNYLADMFTIATVIKLMTSIFNLIGYLMGFLVYLGIAIIAGVSTFSMIIWAPSLIYSKTRGKYINNLKPYLATALIPAVMGFVMFITDYILLVSFEVAGSSPEYLPVLLFVGLGALLLKITLVFQVPSLARALMNNQMNQLTDIGESAMKGAATVGSVVLGAVTGGAGFASLASQFTGSGGMLSNIGNSLKSKLSGTQMGSKMGFRSSTPAKDNAWSNFSNKVQEMRSPGSASAPSYGSYSSQMQAPQAPIASQPPVQAAGQSIFGEGATRITEPTEERKKRHVIRKDDSESVNNIRKVDSKDNQDKLAPVDSKMGNSSTSDLESKLEEMRKHEDIRTASIPTSSSLKKGYKEVTNNKSNPLTSDFTPESENSSGYFGSLANQLKDKVTAKSVSQFALDAISGKGAQSLKQNFGIGASEIQAAQESQQQRFDMSGLSSQEEVAVTAQGAEGLMQEGSESKDLTIDGQQVLANQTQARLDENVEISQNISSNEAQITQLQDSGTPQDLEVAQSLGIENSRLEKKRDVNDLNVKIDNAGQSALNTASKSSFKTFLENRSRSGSTSAAEKRALSHLTKELSSLDSEQAMADSETRWQELEDKKKSLMSLKGNNSLKKSYAARADQIVKNAARTSDISNILTQDEILLLDEVTEGINNSKKGMEYLPTEEDSLALERINEKIANSELSKNSDVIKFYEREIDARSLFTDAQINQIEDLVKTNPGSEDITRLSEFLETRKSGQEEIAKIKNKLDSGDGHVTIEDKAQLEKDILEGKINRNEVRELIMLGEQVREAREIRKEVEVKMELGSLNADKKESQMLSDFIKKGSASREDLLKIKEILNRK